MNDFLSLARQRQSDRAFDPDRPVEKDKLQRILQAACIAPSACNSQPWHFVVVDDSDLKSKVADATSNRVLGINHFTKQAPVHIIVVEEKPNLSAGFGSWVKDKNFAHLDVGIAAAHIVLAAEDEGLGSCILGWFDEAKMRELLSIPKGKRVLLDVVIGYSTQPDRPKKRKEAEKVISFNQY